MNYEDVDSINKFFESENAEFITSKTIEFVMDSINEVMNPVEIGVAINEYGDYRVELQMIDIICNDDGEYCLTHYGRIGDYGWRKSVIIHKKCDIKVLMDNLRRKFGRRVEYDVDLRRY